MTTSEQRAAKELARKDREHARQLEYHRNQLALGNMKPVRKNKPHIYKTRGWYRVTHARHLFKYVPKTEAYRLCEEAHRFLREHHGN